MANFDTFKAEWLGRSVDYDHVYGAQCVDLVRQYVAELYGLTDGVHGNAIDYWNSPTPTLLGKFHKVNSPDAVQGDIVVLFGLSGNPYGHIGIATGNQTGTEVEILEQNGQTGNGSGVGGDAIRTRFVDKSRIAGLLRPTVQAPAPATPPPYVPPTPSTPPQGAMTLNTGTEQYEIVVTVPGYVTSNQAANHLKKAVDVSPAMYFVFSKVQTPVGVMINVTKEAGRPGAWINPADNVIPPPPEPVVAPVVEQAPVPMVSNVTVVPSAGSVVGTTPTPKPVTDVIAATATTLTPAPETAPVNWRSTFIPFVDGPRTYTWIGQTGEVVHDLEGRSKDFATKLSHGNTVLKISSIGTKDNIEYARIDASVKPASMAFSFHAVPVMYEDGESNLRLNVSVPVAAVQATKTAAQELGIGWQYASRLLTSLANTFDAWNEKINKKGTA